MKFNSMRVCLAVGFLLTLLTSLGTVSGAETGKEHLITDVPGDQKYSYINENKVVWMDESTGDSNILFYDLGPDGIFGTSDDGGERVIANKVGVNEYWPEIYGNLIPYTVSEFGIEESKEGKLNTSVFLFNLKNNVTVDLVSPGDPYFQCCPQAYDITITWWDMREGNTDVYLYDLGLDGIYGTEDDGGEFLVTASEPDTKQGPPFIWGRNLVWTDYRDGKGDVYLYDAGPDGRFNTDDDRGEFRVTDEIGSRQVVWDVREHMIVWRDKRNWGGSKYDVYGYDMGPDGIFDTSDDRGEFRLTDENADQKYPVVYSNIIAWEDSRSGNADLYIYDLGPDEIFNTSDDIGEIPLVTNPSNQKRMEIYDGKIVFDDGRSGDLNVYMYDLAAQTAAGDTIKPTPTPTTPAPSTAAPKSEPTPASKGGICGPTLLVLLAMLPLLWRFYRPGEKRS
jgi:beta propeller repeat protein